METNTTRESLKPYEAATQGTLLIWPAIGVMAALLFASFHFDSVWFKGVAMGSYVVGVFVAVGIQAKKTGVQPSFAAMPKALRRNMYRFVLGCSALAAVALILAFATNFLIAGLVVGVGMTMGGSLYHVRSRTIVTDLLAGV